jgi:hypothetical protein
MYSVSRGCSGRTWVGLCEGGGSRVLGQLSVCPEAALDHVPGATCQLCNVHTAHNLTWVLVATRWLLAK